MKKIIALATILSLSSLATTAQVRFFDREYFFTSVSVDPVASIKEGGINTYGEIGLISHFGYVSAGVEIFPQLQGGYAAFTGTAGLNVTVGYFDETRIYGGLRLGLIKRGYTNNDPQTYPLAGLEIGVDQMLTDNLYVGARFTRDHREDFLYSGAKPEGQNSCGVKVGWRW